MCCDVSQGTHGSLSARLHARPARSSLTNYPATITEIITTMKLGFYHIAGINSSLSHEPKCLQRRWRQLARFLHGVQLFTHTCTGENNLHCITFYFRLLIHSTHFSSTYLFLANLLSNIMRKHLLGTVSKSGPSMHSVITEHSTFTR